MRWSHASCSRLAVVVLALGGFDGDTDSTSRDATIRDVSGERSVALVVCGSARRVTAAFCGFLPGSLDCVMSPTALGVGVSVGTPLGCARFLGGVEGGASDDCFFRFRGLTDGGGGMASGDGLA